MPLVEIIVGEKTSDETLARGFDYVLQIGKTPIVVNDRRGFYTSRVFGTYVMEGIAMLAEGVHPRSIEVAGLQAGMAPGTRLMAHAYSPASILSYHSGSYVPVYGVGRHHARQPVAPVVCCDGLCAPLRATAYRPRRNRLCRWLGYSRRRSIGQNRCAGGAKPLCHHLQPFARSAV